jgi:hypothetical protein
MKTRLSSIAVAFYSTNLSLVLLLAGSLAAGAVTEEKLNKRFTVQPGGSLVVDVGFGSIEVRTNDTREVVVDVWRKVGRSNKAAEEAFLKDNPVEFVQNGTSVTVHSSNKGRTSSSFSLWGRRNSNEARYVVTVPSQFNADLKTGGGSVSVSDLAGNVKSHTGGGGLALAGLHGSLEGDTGGGGIKVNDCEGAIKLNTGGGNVDVSGGSGSLEARTGGGSVSVKKFAGPAHLRSGGGGLTVENVTGEIDGSTGGGSVNALLPSEIAEPVSLSTGGGGISVSVPATAAFNLDAHTGGGGVSSEVPVMVTGKVEHERLQGPVNGGGKAVVLRSGGEGIRIMKL